MLERFKTRVHSESYDHKLGAALRMERALVEILELGVRNASQPRVQALLSESLEYSRAQVESLESIFLLFGWEVAESPSPPMAALTKACEGAIRAAEGAAVDAVALEAALTAAHIEVGAYETLIIHADAMGRPEVVERLEPILDSNRRALERTKALLAEVLDAGPRSGADG